MGFLCIAVSDGERGREGDRQCGFLEGRMKGLLLGAG